MLIHAFDCASARVLGGSSIPMQVGVMITASHNPERDNGAEPRTRRFRHPLIHPRNPKNKEDPSFGRFVCFEKPV